MSDGWEKVFDPEGRTYYINHITKEVSGSRGFSARSASQLTLPGLRQTSWEPPVQNDLPEGWEERTDDQVRAM